MGLCHLEWTSGGSRRSKERPWELPTELYAEHGAEYWLGSDRCFPLTCLPKEKIAYCDYSFHWLVSKTLFSST